MKMAEETERSFKVEYGPGVGRMDYRGEQVPIMVDLDYLESLTRLPIRIRDKANPKNPEERVVKVRRGDHSRPEGHVFVYEVVDNEVLEYGAMRALSKAKYTPLQIQELRQEDALEEK